MPTHAETPNLFGADDLQDGLETRNWTSRRQLPRKSQVGAATRDMWFPMYVFASCIGVCPTYRVCKRLRTLVSRQLHLIIRNFLSGASYHRGRCRRHSPPSPGAG